MSKEISGVFYKQDELTHTPPFPGGTRANDFETVLPNFVEKVDMALIIFARPLVIYISRIWFLCSPVGFREFFV